MTWQLSPPPPWAALLNTQLGDRDYSITPSLSGVTRFLPKAWGVDKEEE